MNHFLIGLCDVWRKVDFMTISNDQISGWSEKLESTSQSQTCTKKRSWSLFGGLLPIWSTTAFWILRTPLYIWEIHSANSWDAPKTSVPAASIGQQNEPSSSPWQCLTACHTTNASKVEQIGLLSFTSSAIFTWLLAKQLPLLQASQKLFTRKLLPQPSGGRKCFLRVCGILKHRFLCYRNKQTYISLAKMC